MFQYTFHIIFYYNWRYKKNKRVTKWQHIFVQLNLIKSKILSTINIRYLTQNSKENKSI